MLSLPTLSSFFLTPRSGVLSNLTPSGVPLPLTRRHTPEQKLRLVSGSHVLAFQGGDRIKGFNPHRDYSEIDVSWDEPRPRITVEERPRICGVRVLMNDTVIADIMGIRELDPSRIVLVPV